MTVSAAALVGGLTVGAITVPSLAARGLHHLGLGAELSRTALLSAAVLGAVSAAAVAVIVAHRDVALVPAMLVWSCALSALALCDALTQRVPTALVRQATVTTGVLLIGGAAVGGAWGVIVVAAAASAAAGLAFLAAWRYADAGYGDVRLTTFGGLGLGFATLPGVAAGIGVWALVLAVQTLTLRANGGSLRTRVALGPGLAAGFVVAAIFSA